MREMLRKLRLVTGRSRPYEMQARVNMVEVYEQWAAEAEQILAQRDVAKRLKKFKENQGGGR